MAYFIHEFAAGNRRFIAYCSSLSLGVMFALSDSLSYYYFRECVDMRKGFDALCGVVRGQMQCNPLSGEVFLLKLPPLVG